MDLARQTHTLLRLPWDVRMFAWAEILCDVWRVDRVSRWYENTQLHMSMHACVRMEQWMANTAKLESSARLLALFSKVFTVAGPMPELPPNLLLFWPLRGHQDYGVVASAAITSAIVGDPKSVFQELHKKYNGSSGAYSQFYEVCNYFTHKTND